MAKVVKTFVFDSERDAGLLDRLDSLPDGEKSAAVREGLRLYFAQAAPNLSDLMAEIVAVREAVEYLKRHGVAVPEAVPAGDEDEDAALLDALLEMGE